jgi:hypothetical protein
LASVTAVCRPQVPQDPRSAASLKATVTPATGVAEPVAALPVTVTTEVFSAGEGPQPPPPEPGLQTTIVEDGSGGSGAGDGAAGEDAVPHAVTPPQSASASPAAAAAFAIIPCIIVMPLPSWPAEAGGLAVPYCLGWTLGKAMQGHHERAPTGSPTSLRGDRPGQVS